MTAPPIGKSTRPLGEQNWSEMELDTHLSGFYLEFEFREEAFTEAPLVDPGHLMRKAIAEAQILL